MQILPYTCADARKLGALRRGRPSAREGVKETLHLPEGAKRVVRGGRPPGRLRVAGASDEDTDTPARDGLEGVLVRDVVAEVDRHHIVAVEVERFEQVQNGLPFVPVDVRLDLVDHLARRHLQPAGIVVENILDDLAHPGPLFFGDEPVVCGHGGFFRLDEGAPYRVQLRLKSPLYVCQQPPEILALFALDLAARGAPDVEAVAPGDDQVVHAHKPLNHGAVAPADHTDGAAGGQIPHDLAHALRDHGVLGTIHDGRQGAVVVEEHGRPPAREFAGQPVAIFECVRQISYLAGHGLSYPHATRLDGPSTYSPSSRRASAAAPSTPDSGPSVASSILTRSREGDLALRCTSSRAGPRMNSPAWAAPPPTGMTSGLKMLTNPARPIPNHRPVSSRTEMEASSPSPASLLTSSPSTSLSTASRPRAEFGFSLATSRARRRMAVPEARASRQPWLPQPQRGPVGSSVTCPSSPPEPWAPLKRIPWVMMPPPTPVPSVMNTW